MPHGWNLLETHPLELAGNLFSRVQQNAVCGDFHPGVLASATTLPSGTAGGGGWVLVSHGRCRSWVLAKPFALQDLAGSRKQTLLPFSHRLYRQSFTSYQLAEQRYFRWSRTTFTEQARRVNLEQGASKG